MLKKSDERKEEKLTDLTACPYCSSPIGRVVWDEIYKVFVCTVCDNRWEEDADEEDFFVECPHCNARHSMEWVDDLEEWQCGVCEKNPERE